MEVTDTEIREYKNYNEQEILKLYISVGWTAYMNELDVLKVGFQNSLLTLTTYESDTLLGVIRTVGDSQTIVYIQDILVLPEYQHQGIGTALVQMVLEHFREARRINLTTNNTLKIIAFYESLGFIQMTKMGCCGFYERLKNQKQGC